MINTQWQNHTAFLITFLGILSWVELKSELKSHILGRGVILVFVLEPGLTINAVPPGATITSRSAVRIRINF